MTEEEIHYICKQYNIENYTINDDLTINVDGDVILAHRNLQSIPLKFGKVSGVFNCSSNSLSSLYGSPIYVGGDFRCEHNELINLEHSPKYIGGDFYCFQCELSTLEYSPPYVGKTFSCVGNKITTLQHMPMNFHIGEGLYCFNNDIKSSLEFSRVLFGYVGGNIEIDGYEELYLFLNNNKNPPKKDLPRILSELRKIRL